MAMKMPYTWGLTLTYLQVFGMALQEGGWLHAGCCFEDEDLMIEKRPGRDFFLKITPLKTGTTLEMAHF